MLLSGTENAFSESSEWVQARTHFGLYSPGRCDLSGVFCALFETTAVAGTGSGETLFCDGSVGRGLHIVASVSDLLADLVCRVVILVRTSGVQILTQLRDIV